MAYIVDGESFTHRAIIPIDKDNIDGNLTDFTTSFDMSALSTADFWAITTGADIYATLSNGTTRVGLELKNVNTGTETGQAYALISSVSSSVDTEWILYYGNAAVTQPAEDAPYGKEAAWPSKCKTVHHFDQDPSGGAPQAIDSTSNDNDGTSSGSMTSGDLIDSTFGKAWQTDGVDDYSSSDAAEISTSTGTIELFFKTNFAYNDTSTTTHFYMWSLYVNDGDRFYLYYDENLDKWGLGPTSIFSVVQSFASGTVFHIAATWDSGAGTKRRLYLDGVEITTSVALPAFTLPSNIDIAVGEFSATKTSWSPIEIIDYRQYNAEEDAEWIKANNICLRDQSSFYKAATYEVSVGDGLNAILLGTNA